MGHSNDCSVTLVRTSAQTKSSWENRNGVATCDATPLAMRPLIGATSWALDASQAHVHSNANPNTNPIAPKRATLSLPTWNIILADLLEIAAFVALNAALNHHVRSVSAVALWTIPSWPVIHSKQRSMELRRRNSAVKCRTAIHR